VTRILIGLPPDWGVAVSTDPTVRCSWLAAAAGNAAGTGSPWRGGPGHVPAVSIAWELIPSSDASSICLVAVVVLVASDGSWSISVHSALCSWKPTPGQAWRSVARICCESAMAWLASTGPLNPITRPCGSARKPCAPYGITAVAKVQSTAAIPVASTIVTATQASSSHEARALRTRKDTPSPRMGRSYPPSMPATDPSSSEMTWSARSISASSWVAARAVIPSERTTLSSSSMICRPVW
jgi:hypothetical protein